MLKNVSIRSAKDARWDELLPTINDSWDTPMSSFTEAEGWVQYITTKAAAVWLIIVDNEFAGCFVLLHSPTVENRYHSSTFLLNKFRGTGLNKKLKTAVVQAFKDTPDKELVAFILADNTRSISAMHKIFPEIIPEPVSYKEQDGTVKSRLFYDLGHAEHNIEVRKDDIYQQIINWNQYSA